MEFALVEKDVLYGLSQGNQVLKAIHKEMSLEKAERILDETADAIAYQEVCLSRNEGTQGRRSMQYANVLLQEMSQLLGQQISNADEEAVLEEYARLQQELVSFELVMMDQTDALAEPNTTRCARYDSHTRCSFSRDPIYGRSGGSITSQGDTKSPGSLSSMEFDSNCESRILALIQHFQAQLQVQRVSSIALR